MEGRRQRRRFENGSASLAVEKHDAVVVADFSGGADAAVEILEIRAARHGDMLAVVHMFAAGEQIGGGAAAEMRLAFDQFDLKARFSESQSRRQPGESPAQDQNAFRIHSPPTRGRTWRARVSRFFRRR